MIRLLSSRAKNRCLYGDKHSGQLGDHPEDHFNRLKLITGPANTLAFIELG